MHAETETRWMVLGTDGRHVSLGRTAPSEADAMAASDALAAQGLSGWLARMQGEYYSRSKISVEPLQRIGITHDADWQAALTAFHAARHWRSPLCLKQPPPQMKRRKAVALYD